MCGIAGVLSTRHGDLEHRVGLLLDAQHHRGPDAGGVWADDLCALGHRRLAIIDLSDTGQQPLCNEDGSIWITFNGAIYNFRALRQELEGYGHRFRTATDTEVIVHAYEQWATGCVRRLRGMFAFGLWDQPRRRLLLARDRVGKKPLFYTEAGGCFRFASELQGLLNDVSVPRTVNLPALDAYLTWGYIPAPHTAYGDIFRLPPAHWLTLEFTSAGSRIRIERYWSLQYRPKLRISEVEACAVLREKLSEAVRLRMVSDVPLGVFLSGGIDSSIVVGLMAKLSGHRITTFSVGFESPAYNELGHARRVAQRWGADHHDIIVRPDALTILPKLVRHYGEPYADSSAIPTFVVSLLARPHVLVALSGDGGDESFAGYERYWGNRFAERIRWLPGASSMARALCRVLPDAPDPRHHLRKVKRFLGVATRPMAVRYGHWVGAVGDQEKQLLYHEDMRPLLAWEGPTDWMHSLFAEVRHLDPVEAAMAVDIQSYLPYDLLVKVDIAAMANSLEVRSPFLDHHVMEFAARLPVDLKLRGKDAKYLLKRAFADLLPPENIRRPKMGFGMPVGEWFRGPLRPLLEDTLLSQRAMQRGYFRPASLHRLVTAHVQRHADHSLPLWSLLMLELWHREFIDQ